MGSFSLVHWVIFFLVVIVLFGASRLPKIGEGLGKGIRSFRKEIKDITDDDGDDDDLVGNEKIKIIKRKAHPAKKSARKRAKKV